MSFFAYAQNDIETRIIGVNSNVQKHGGRNGKC